MASTAVVKGSRAEIAQRLRRAYSTMQNFKEKAAETGDRIVASSLAIAGGGLSGVLRGWNEDGSNVEVPGTDIPLDLAAGGALLVVGISGMGGKSSDYLCSLGSGMAAAATAFYVKEATQRAKAEG